MEVEGWSGVVVDAVPSPDAALVDGLGSFVSSSAGGGLFTLPPVEGSTMGRADPAWTMTLGWVTTGVVVVGGRSTTGVAGGVGAVAAGGGGGGGGGVSAAKAKSEERFMGTV